MELVYLYVDHLGRCIDNTGINFSKNFEVTYYGWQHNLKIEKKNNPNRINIYGDNIQDINVLVGKNGVGKTTIMKLLGFSEIDRRKYFHLNDLIEDDGTGQGFAVYH